MESPVHPGAGRCGVESRHALRTAWGDYARPFSPRYGLQPEISARPAARIDLAPYKRAQSGGYVNAPDYVTGVAMTHYDMMDNLIAAVEALREVNKNTQESNKILRNDREYARVEIETLRERVAELAEALGKLADYLAGELTAMEVPPTDEQSDWPRVHEARSILATTSDEALERARAVEEAQEVPENAQD